MPEVSLGIELITLINRINMKKNSSSFALSPLDGRYGERISNLRPIFSEFGLMKYRLAVEVRYFLALVKLGISPRRISRKEMEYLHSLIEKFSENDFKKIKSLERITNHDVKAVEYFLLEKIKEKKMKIPAELVHLGRTSEDINNLAYALMLREGLKILITEYKEVEKEIVKLAKMNRKIPMLALTHGQPASPTTFGWEMNVFAQRLEQTLKQLKQFRLKVKLNGATGGDNALYVAYPKINWRKFSDDFIASLNKKEVGLKFKNNPFTTQIESHDTYRELFDLLRGLNLILIDFNQDMWFYISRGVLGQIHKAGEVGSSAMPQKVNPINFENAEGNLGLANNLCEFMGRKLTASRMQIDLSDSTVERNFGLVFGYTQIALSFILKGLGRIKVDKKEMKEELNKHWEVISEAYQVILRGIGVEEGYELLKDFTRGKLVDGKTMHAFVDKVAEKYKLSKDAIIQLKKITPENYTGNRNF